MSRLTTSSAPYALANAFPFDDPESGLAQALLAGLDQTRATLQIALIGTMAQMAWSQGCDLFAFANGLLLRGAEYVAKYNLGMDVPYTAYVTTGVSLASISDVNRGLRRPAWDLLYNHYAVLRNQSAPWSQAFADLIRPDAGPGAVGADPAQYDQVGWQALMHSYRVPDGFVYPYDMPWRHDPPRSNTPAPTPSVSAAPSSGALSSSSSSGPAPSSSSSGPASSSSSPSRAMSGWKSSSSSSSSLAPSGPPTSSPVTVSTSGAAPSSSSVLLVGTAQPSGVGSSRFWPSKTAALSSDSSPKTTGLSTPSMRSSLESTPAPVSSTSSLTPRPDNGTSGISQPVSNPRSSVLAVVSQETTRTDAIRSLLRTLSPTFVVGVCVSLLVAISLLCSCCSRYRQRSEQKMDTRMRIMQRLMDDTAAVDVGGLAIGAVTNGGASDADESGMSAALRIDAIFFGASSKPVPSGAELSTQAALASDDSDRQTNGAV